MFALHKKYCHIELVETSHATKFCLTDFCTAVEMTDNQNTANERIFRVGLYKATNSDRVLSQRKRTLSELILRNNK